MNGMTTFGYNSNGSVNVTSPFSPHTQEYTTNSTYTPKLKKTHVYDDGFPIGVFVLICIAAVLAFGFFLGKE